MITGWANRLTRHQVGIVVGSVVVTVISLIVITGLRFNSDLANLLPEDNKQLRILRRIQAKYSSDTAFMVLLSKNIVFVAENGGGGGAVRIHDGSTWHRWPMPAPVHALWGFSARDVFAAGEGGTIQRYRGEGWAAERSGTRATLRGLWGPSPEGLIAVGDGGVALRRGKAGWRALPTGTRVTLRAVSGTADDAVYAVGDGGTILRLDGDRFIQEPWAGKTDLLAVWAGGGEAFAVGRAGTVLRRTSTGTWKRLTSPTRLDLHGLWGPKPDDLMIVGERGTLLRFDGQALKPDSSRFTQGRDLLAAHGTSAKDLWAVGDRCAATRWTGSWREGPRVSWADHKRDDERGFLYRLFRSKRFEEPPCHQRYTAVWRPTADLTRAKAFAPRLVAALKKIPGVGRIEYRRPVGFFLDRALYYTSIDDLERLRDRIDESLERETAKSTGLYVELDEGNSQAKKQELEQLSGSLERKAESLGVGADSWYTHPDGTSIGLLVYAAKGGSDFEFLRRMWHDLERAVGVSGYKKVDPQLRIDVTGDAVSKVRDYDDTINDIFGLAPYAIGGIILLMALYFRSVVGLLFVALPLGMSICWTFALTTIFIGQLNLVTGFLFVVLFGLGIDYGLQLYGRYREGRRAGLSREDSNNHMILDTGRATITSAVTTAAALFSLTLADFRGFSEFGFIAGMGVLLAMVSFLTVMPVLINLAERFRLLRFAKQDTQLPLQRRRAPGEPFTAPRVVLAVSLVLAGFGVYGATQIKFEYDFNNLQPEHFRDEVRERSSSSLGRSFTPTLMLADSRTELDAALKAIKVRSRRLKKSSMLKAVHSILSFVPQRQREKRLILDEISELLADKRWRLVSDGVQRRMQIDRLRKMAKARPFGLKDLPKEIRRAFRGPGFGDVWLAMVFHNADLRHIEQARTFRRQFGAIQGARLVHLGNLLPPDARATTDGTRADIRCPGGAAPCVEGVTRRLRELRHQGRAVFTDVLSAREAYRKKLAVSGSLRGQVFARVGPDFLLRTERGAAPVQPSGTFHVSNAELVLDEVVRVLFTEGRYAFVFAFAAVFLAALLDLRSFRFAVAACLPLIVGFLWTFEVIHLVGLKLNIFNFIIMPALLGVGIDYGVHYVHRYRTEGRGRLNIVMQALYWVILACAATTVVSFGNMALAHHPGLRSLGQLSVVGLTCIFFASTYTLPALLYTLERLRPVETLPLAEGQARIVALSYCPAGKLIQRLLTDHGVSLDYVAIDTLPPEEQERVARELWEESGARSLPLTRIAGRFIEGYDADALRNAIREVKLEGE